MTTTLDSRILAFDDTTSPWEEARSRYAGAANVRLLTVAGGRQVVLNSSHHRSVAASVVLFLESLKANSELIFQESVR